MTPAGLRIDREASAARIARDVETLAGPEYTLSPDAIRRYAYTDAYRNALEYFTHELTRIGFEVAEDPVGNLVARNRPAGEPAFGVGSHCDSNRNGGKWDGTLGVVAALEVCRLERELGLGLPLQLVSFLEEEGSAFGVGLLGSRIVAGRVTEDELRHGIRAIDDGRPFWEHAAEAGYEPDRWRDCARMLDGLTGWIELHIEQGRVLQDTGTRLGIVTAIVGITWADLVFEGRADHAGGTPMDLREDAGLAAAETAIELERLALEAGEGTVATAGECEWLPGLKNVIPGRARLGVDIRSVDGRYRDVATHLRSFAREAAGRRGVRAEYVEISDTPPTAMDERVVRALAEAANEGGETYRLMPSGAGHDTQLVAPTVPSAMVFVPCKDGISHDPAEEASPADAAAGVEVVLNAIVSLVR